TPTMNVWSIAMPSQRTCSSGYRTRSCSATLASQPSPMAPPRRASRPWQVPSPTWLQNRSKGIHALPVINIPWVWLSTSGCADTPAQPHTLIPSSGKERLRQAGEERRQAEEETARQEEEQAANLEEERVRKAKETALASTEVATTAHQTLLPTEVAPSSKPPV